MQDPASPQTNAPGLDTAEQDQLSQAAQHFLQQGDSVMIASRSRDGEPHISYAPIVSGDDSCVYLLLSELAEHTGNLLHHGRCEVMLIEAAAAARNPFARQRLTLRCQVTELTRGGDEYNHWIEQLRQRQGDTVPLLASLGDFHLLRLIPMSGRFVQGFGRAWALSLEQGRLQVCGQVSR